MEPQEVLKVVRRLPSGILVSAFAEGKASVRYIPGQYVFAPDWLAEQGYGLTCYLRTDLSEALEFTRGDSTELWVAHAVGLSRPTAAMCDMGALAEGYLKEEKRPWPPGTVMAKGIRLLRQIGVGDASGYKVVRITQNKCYSAEVDQAAQVEYALYHLAFAPSWLERKGYFLTFFPNYEDALQFLSTRSGQRVGIMQVEASGVLYELPPYCDPAQVATGKVVPGKGQWAAGTAMAKAILPTRWTVRKVGKG